MPRTAASSLILVFLAALPTARGWHNTPFSQYTPEQLAAFNGGDSSPWSVCPDVPTNPGTTNAACKCGEVTCSTGYYCFLNYGGGYCAEGPECAASDDNKAVSDYKPCACINDATAGTPTTWRTCYSDYPYCFANPEDGQENKCSEYPKWMNTPLSQLSPKEVAALPPPWNTTWKDSDCPEDVPYATTPAGGCKCGEVTCSTDYYCFPNYGGGYCSESPKCAASDDNKAVSDYKPCKCINDAAGAPKTCHDWNPYCFANPVDGQENPCSQYPKCPEDEIALTDTCKCGTSYCSSGEYCFDGGQCYPYPKCNTSDHELAATDSAPCTCINNATLISADSGVSVCENSEGYSRPYCFANPEAGQENQCFEFPQCTRSDSVAAADTNNQCTCGSNWQCGICWDWESEEECQEKKSYCWTKERYSSDDDGWGCKDFSYDEYVRENVVIGLLVMTVTSIIITVIASIAVAIDRALKQEEEATFWEAQRIALAKPLGLTEDSLILKRGRRSETANLEAGTTSKNEAYRVFQVLSTTSGSTLTTMVVSQLQAANYTGPMPTMITATVTGFTQSGGSGGNESDNTMILVAVVVAVVCLLLALLVIGALVYLWKRNKQPAQPSGEPATPHQITMGSVGAVMNPMHAQHMKMQQ